ncbi:MAG TPA: NAD-dependent epimerase/dehydratase family protein [Polyangia bacterium]
MKRALVIGGGGFIGGHLARRLSAEGYWVRCLDLQRPRYAPSAANEFVLGDLREPVTVKLALAGGFDEVYQVAADRTDIDSDSFGKNDADVVRNTALINLNVLHACTSPDVGVGRIFYASSAGAGSDDESSWDHQFAERIYLSHAASYGLNVRIARLPTVFGPEGPWNDGRAAVPAELCRKIAAAEPNGEIEIWSDNQVPRAFLPIEECLSGIQRLMRSDRVEPVSLGSYALTVLQLAHMLMAIAGKSLSIRNIACQLEAKGSSSRTRFGWGADSPLQAGLRSLYQWIRTQLETGKPEQARVERLAFRRTRKTDVCLRERVSDAIRGRDLIDWADTDFASLLRQLGAIHLSDDLSEMKDGAIYVASLPAMVRRHAERPSTHVLITSLDENWGAFSSHIPQRTYPQGNWEERVIEAGCTPEAVRKYLDDPAVRAVVTPQHTAFHHPAILSIPIGIHNPQALLTQLKEGNGEKRDDLLINNNAWAEGDRERINDRVIANFGGDLRNTYGLPLTEFYRSIARSRFVLCPSGMGLDTHRLWETVILGSIPIVERCPGWQAVLDDLPALWVDDFAEVTPGLLARAYQDVHAQCDRFDFIKLTRQWWTTKIHGLLSAPERRMAQG